MFRVIKYRNVSGKIQATIETDDQTAADFIRFFGSINKFVDLFHYRMRTAKSFDLYQKTAPHKMALHKKELAGQLERFRTMPGTRLDLIDVEIRHAIQYEKEEKQLTIKKLRDSGKSLDDIAKALEIPKTTVARYLKKLRPPENPPEAEASMIEALAQIKIDELQSRALRRFVAEEINGSSGFVVG